MRILLALCFAAFFALPAFAQSSDVGKDKLKAPTSEAGKAFDAHARIRWQRTSADYLGKNADPKLASPKERSSFWDSLRNAKFDGSTARIIAAIILITMIIALLMLWWNNRIGGGLFSRKANDARLSNAETPEAFLSSDGNTLEDLSLAQLRSIEDPRVGMHHLMVQALNRAADQNNIPLKRSFTTRDIEKRVPRNWQHKDLLGSLVQMGELVLFGGRPITQEKFTEILDLAAPLLSGKGRR